jgi:drug/metabolite transporter (DMT)-like permease
MPLMVAILTATILKEAFTLQKSVGLVLIAAGAVGIVCGTGGALGTAQNVGHLAFLAAALAWAGYTVAMRQARLDGLHAAAIAAVGSLVLYLPAYAVIAGARVFQAPLSDIVLQAVIQGVLTAIVALLLYGRMVGILGATRGAAFVALTPAMTGAAWHSRSRRAALDPRLDGHRPDLARRLCGERGPLPAPRLRTSVGAP